MLESKRSWCTMSTNFYLVGFFFCVLIIQGSSGVADDHVGTATEGRDSANFPLTTPESVNVEKLNTTATTATTPPITPTTVSTTPNANSPTKTTPTKTTPPTTTPPTTTPPTTTPSTTPTTSQTTTTAKTTTPPTTTSVPPVTTPPPGPTPLPVPEFGSWVLFNSTTNLTCAIIDIALRIKIPYISTENQTLEWGQLNLPKDANITGVCDDVSIKSNISQVRLLWSNNTNYLDITFKRYNESKTFNITRLYLTQNVSGDTFPNNTMAGMVHYQGNGSGLFAVSTVPLGSSYRCFDKVNVNVTELNASTPKIAILSFYKVQIQAFVNTTSGTFGGVYDCPGMDTSDIVPIAVGCALAGLVIGVLIAYLIGRRSSHASGYLSM